MGKNRITRQKGWVDNKRKRVKEHKRGAEKYRECQRARRGSKKLKSFFKS